MDYKLDCRNHKIVSLIYVCGNEIHNPLVAANVFLEQDSKYLRTMSLIGTGQPPNDSACVVASFPGSPTPEREQ